MTSTASARDVLAHQESVVQPPLRFSGTRWAGSVALAALLLFLSLSFAANAQDAPSDVEYAKRWWNALTAEQMVASLYGNEATREQAAAAKKMYGALDPETKGKVNQAAKEIYGAGGHMSVGAWWETLDCRQMRIAAGDGNVDAASAFCAHYPGSDHEKILTAASLEHVNKVGQALLGRNDPGVYPPDNEYARRWWNALTAEQMVASLYGNEATPEQAAAAKKLYGALDPETKGKVNRATAEIYGVGGHMSVGAWWETLDCRQMRIAAGDGNVDAASAFCAHYPGSDHEKILTAASLEHVNRVGMALLGREDPGPYPPADVDYAKRWWNALSPDQMVASLYGEEATPDQQTAAKKLYGALDPETKGKVNQAAKEIYGAGGHMSVGAWWETLDCRQMRIAAGDGNVDAASAFCAHYPGSGHEKILAAAPLERVNKVGMALLGRSDPGVYPSGTAMAKVAKTLLAESARMVLASTVDSVRNRITAGLARPSGSSASEAFDLSSASGWLRALEAHGTRLGDDGLDAARLLAGSSFELSLGAENGGTSSMLGNAVFWGSGDWRELSGASSGVSWDGRMASGHIGADTRLGRDAIAGLSLSLSNGRFDYEEGSGATAHTGTYETDQIGIHPYAGMTLSSGIELWAMAGYGSGDVEINDSRAGRLSGDLTQTSAAAGVKGQVYASDSLIAGGQTTVDVRAEGALSKAEIDGLKALDSISADVQLLRVAVEAGHVQTLTESAILRPSLEVGVRSDGGDGGTGTGVEVGGALSYLDTVLDLTLEIRGRVLAGHSGDTEEWGIGGLIRKGAGGDGRGLSLSLAPGLGVVDSSAGSVSRWTTLSPGRTNQVRDDVRAHLVAEVGYGLPTLNGQGLLTPYAGFTLSEDGARNYRTGGRLGLGPSMALSLEGAWKEPAADGTSDQELMLRASLSW